MKLALIGKSGAGKSQAAAIIAEQLQVEIVKTGRICRQISQILFGDDSKGSTQRLDDALTHIDGSIFLKAALRDFDETSGLVVDSLRFASDVEYVAQRGFRLMRIEAADGVRIERLRARGQAFNFEIDGKHRSEVELSEVPVDYVIANDADVDTLRERIKLCFSGIE